MKIISIIIIVVALIGGAYIVGMKTTDEASKPLISEGDPSKIDKTNGKGY